MFRCNPTISEADYEYILNHAGVKYVFISTKDLLRKIQHILPKVASVKGVYSFTKIADTPCLCDLVEEARKNPVPEEVEAIKATIKPNDLATLIYTSGTTGNPKGVMLSHNNILSNVMAVRHIPPLEGKDKALSYLPLCHIYERTINYTWQYLGVATYYAESMATIADNMKEVKPQLMSTVPRLLERIFDKIMNTGRKLKGIKRMFFFWAVNLGNRFKLHGGNGLFYKLQLKIVSKLVFSKWRAATGGNLNVMVSGGAALQPRLSRIFWAAGIPVLEGYGLTETSPCIAVQHFGRHGHDFGTVGPPLSNVEVKIAPDGEILTKGPHIMLGYYKEPELTRQTIKEDGWLHTGDIGLLQPDGQLSITGRKKAAFKTSFGKYINPEVMEEKFKESSFIDTLMVLGENQKFAAALIVPDFVHLKSYCVIKNIPYSTDAEMVENSVLRKRFQVEVDKFNVSFGSYEQIKRFELIGNEWNVDGGELTPTLKIRRSYIANKYKSSVAKLFSLAE
ncbi:MAG: long-chain fatty acid--CoA ligase [Bacteroidales bacterium]|nr:long-chain fatty acid--CoA ligase [Bacteroidales bacterium]MDZ4204865.1 long-chain fatty acid--CoA ligase [Bacteroidales bacterium]